MNINLDNYVFSTCFWVESLSFLVLKALYIHLCVSLFQVQQTLLISTVGRVSSLIILISSILSLISRSIEICLPPESNPILDFLFELVKTYFQRVLFFITNTLQVNDLFEHFNGNFNDMSISSLQSGSALKV